MWIWRASLAQSQGAENLVTEALKQAEKVLDSLYP